MSSAMQTQLAGLVGRLEKAQVGSPDRDDLVQIKINVDDVIENLKLVEEPVAGSDKTGSVSAEQPTYRISREAAVKAKAALHHAATMKSAADRQDWQKALDSARQIQKTMS